MSLTVGIIAEASDAELSSDLARRLTGGNIVCVSGAEEVASAPVAIIVCSPSTVPSPATVRLVERLFVRGARLMPLLVDVDSPPDDLAHFLAGLRS